MDGMVAIVTGASRGLGQALVVSQSWNQRDRDGEVWNGVLGVECQLRWGQPWRSLRHQGLDFGRCSVSSSARRLLLGSSGTAAELDLRHPSANCNAWGCRWNSIRFAIRRASEPGTSRGTREPCVGVEIVQPPPNYHRTSGAGFIPQPRGRWAKSCIVRIWVTATCRQPSQRSQAINRLARATPAGTRSPAPGGSSGRAGFAAAWTPTTRRSRQAVSTGLWTGHRGLGRTGSGTSSMWAELGLALGMHHAPAGPGLEDRFFQVQPAVHGTADGAAPIPPPCQPAAAGSMVVALPAPGCRPGDCGGRPNPVVASGPVVLGPVQEAPSMPPRNAA